jgi:hypothetical protein
MSTALLSGRERQVRRVEVEQHLRRRVAGGDVAVVALSTFGPTTTRGPPAAERRAGGGVGGACARGRLEDVGRRAAGARLMPGLLGGGWSG